MKRAVDLMKENEEVRNIYKVNILFAMRALNIIWEEFTCDLIIKCLRRTDLCPVSGRLMNDSRALSYIEAEPGVLRGQILTMVPVPPRMAIENFLNNESYKVCVEDFNLEKALFESVSDEPDDMDVTKNDPDVATALPTIKEHLKVLASAKLIISGRRETKYCTLKAIEKVQRLLWSNMRSAARQTHIEQYFLVNPTRVR